MEQRREPPFLLYFATMKLVCFARCMYWALQNKMETILQFKVKTLKTGRVGHIFQVGTGDSNKTIF